MPWQAVLCQKVQMQSSSVADDYALWHDSLEIYCMFTFAAFCSLSPDSPTQMLSTSFATRISRILFWDFFSLCTQQWRHQLCSAAVLCSRYRNKAGALPIRRPR